MFTAFLIKYAEIGVKGKNRYLFEDALVNNIRYQLKTVDGNFTVRKENGRIYVETEGDYDYEEDDEHDMLNTFDLMNIFIEEKQ